MIEEKYYKRVFAKPQIYNGIEFRSKIESDFAKYLSGEMFTYKGANYYLPKPVRWQYEAKEFELIPQEEWVDRTEKDQTLKKKVRSKKHTLQRVIYTPDFYLPDYDLYVEVKGKQFDDGLFRLRFRIFKHFYPDTAIWLVKSHEEFFDLENRLAHLNTTKE